MKSKVASITIFVVLMWVVGIDCGGSRRQKRIVGGYLPENTDQYGYLATIYLKVSGLIAPVCGGTHIGSGWIVTAAHCLIVRKGTELVVRMGGKPLSHTQPADYFRVLEAIPCDPSVDSLVRDIALLRILPSSNLPSKSLPDPRFRLLSNLESCEVAGFGSNTYNDVNQDELHVAPIKFVPFSRCRRAIGPSISFAVDGSVLCAGGGLADTCQGDSGAGVICNNSLLIGITSYGSDCGLDGIPAVYTNVKFYANWIRQTIERATTSSTLAQLG